MTFERPPHYARVRALLGALDAPVVQLWGWPGTGKRAILRGILDDEPGAEYLPPTWLTSPLGLERRLDQRFGFRAALLVSPDAVDQEALALATTLLRPGQRLLVGGERRLDLGRGAQVTGPEQLLLRPDEIAALWLVSCGRALTTQESALLHQRSDGWYLPLALWARDPATANGPFDDDDRFDSAPFAGFLRERVLAALVPDELEVVRQLAGHGDISWRSFFETDDRRRCEPTLRSLIEWLGMPRVEDERIRLPRLLVDLLRAEASTRSDGAAVAAAAPGPRNGTPDVRIALLGGARVERRDADSDRLVEVGWTFKRPLRILAYLASAPDLQASREEIVSILWPEASEEAIQRNLHPAVSWLRRTVWPGCEPGGVVLLRDGVYSLDPSLRWEVDVRSFLERIEEGARHEARGRVEAAEASWEAAWRLYQGAFLQGWSDRWILAQRDELQLRFTDLLRRLGDLKARLGRLTDAEDAYRTLLLEDPLEEGVHVSIMRIYAVRGRLDLVNRQYQRLRQVLLQELGVEPSPPTVDVFNDLMLARAPRPYR
jgi:DNA-binding SARP family transcriptional activator